jgi:metal-responsive CopG/Arc/MetJ family transcriptional regulator
MTNKPATVQDTLVDKYPRLTFRLNQALLTKVNHLSRSQNITRGQVIREALEMYYKVHKP